MQLYGLMLVITAIAALGLLVAAGGLLLFSLSEERRPWTRIVGLLMAAGVFGLLYYPVLILFSLLTHHAHGG